MCETTRPELEPEEHLPLLALLERYIYPCWLSLTNGDPAHEHGSHINEASNQSVQPLWVIEKPEDGVYVHIANLLTTQIYPEARMSR
jgi:hypothetical protein